MSRYRADIDGLRAIAVALVVLFHAGIPGFSGGFVGVDAFFVISGYLISDILWRELQTSQFSLLRFYDRRARRILPALLVLLLATTVLGFIYFVPGELRELGTNVIWSALAAGNMLALQNSGYFDGNTQDNPLLHTWSLGVEEQFYVVWPLLLALCWHLLRKRTWPLVVISLASLALAEWAVRVHPSAAFYLLPTRAWELALGGVVATAALRVQVRPALRSGLGLLALAALLFSGSCYSEDTPFPGLTALLPCGAAALLIALGDTQNLASRLLASPACVWLGKRSYSLYLWHWPLLAVGRVHLNRPLHWYEATLAVVVAVGISELSFRWVETPFRDPRSRLVAWLSAPAARGRRFPRSLVVAVLGTAAVALVAFVLVARKGMPERFPASVARYEAARRDTTRSIACHRLQNDASVPATGVCTFGASPASTGQVLLWGDSHADHFRPGLEAAASAKGLSVRQATKSVCPPVLGGVAIVNRGQRAEDCVAFNLALAELASGDPQVKVVALAARWTAYAEGRAGGPVEEADLFVTTGSGPQVLSRSESQRALTLGLRATVEQLSRAGKAILLLGQAPEFPGDVPKCLAREAAAGRGSSRCALARERVEQRASFAVRMLGQLVTAHPQVAVLLPATTLCSKERCEPILGGAVTMRDSNHLSRTGSLLLAADLGRVWPSLP